MRKNQQKNFSLGLRKLFTQNKNDIFTLLILLGIILFFFVPSFIAKDLAGDFIGQKVPWYHFTYVSLREGILPFWSPYAYAGLPHLLKPELALFHPLTVTIIILSFLFNPQQIIGVTGQIIEFVSVGAFFLGAAGVYAIARKVLKLSEIASLFASIAFVLNPFTIIQMHSTYVLYGAMLLPWLVLALYSFLQKPSFASFLAVIICNVLLLVGGYPYWYIYFFLIQVGLALFFGMKKTFLVLIAFLTSGLLSSFFFLTYLDIFNQSSRASNVTDLYFHSFASLTPMKLFQIVFPINYSTIMTTADFQQPLLAGPTLTFGTFALLFLIYGFFSMKNKPFNLWLIAIFFLSLLYSFGGNLQAHSFFGDLFSPIYKLRFHARALMCTILAGSLFVGLGIQAVKEKQRLKYIDIFFWALFLLLLVGLTLGSLYYIERIKLNLQIYQGLATGTLFLFASLMISTLAFKYGKRSIFIVGLIIMVFEYHLYFQNFTDFFTKNISYNQFFAKNSLIPEVPTNDNLFRMYFEDNQFAYNTANLKIYNINGYENTSYESWGERINRYGIFRFYQLSNLKYVVTTTDNWQMGNPDVVKLKTVNPQSLPNETYYHSPDKLHYIYEIKNYLPRFYTPSVVVPCQDLDCLKKENPPKLVMAKGLPERITNPTKDVAIKVVEYTPNTVKLTITTPRKSFVTSSENWDSGWNMKINSKTAPVYDTSNGWRGFVVPPGKSEVVMTYFPSQLILGISLSSVGIVLLFGIWKSNFVEKSDRILLRIRKK